MYKCLNCGAAVPGNYCPSCGQEKITQRMEVKHLLKDVTHGIFHWESSILKTFKELLIRPGKFIRSYIDGIRKPYVKPFSYFIFIQTIYVLIFHQLSDKYFAFFTANVIIKDGVTESMLSKIHEAQHLISANINYLNFIMPLIVAFYIKLFFKKKTGINYAESVVFSLYIVGTSLFFGMLFMLLSMINYQIWDVRLLVNQAYFIFAMMQFSGYSKLKGITLGLFATFLSYITYIVLVAALTVSYILVKG